MNPHKPFGILRVKQTPYQLSYSRIIYKGLPNPYKEIITMNIHLDTPYKIASNPIVIPESLTVKIKALLPKIEKASAFLLKTPKRIKQTVGILRITPEEDIYLHEGWDVKILVTKKPPVGASLDYREQEKTLYISANWKPRYSSLYHEVVHALDPKARPGYKGYIQRDPDTYFTETPGGYFKVPEEIDAIQSSIANRIIEIGKLYKAQDEQSLREENAFKKKLNFEKYLNEINNWLQDPDMAPMPYAMRGMTQGVYIWLRDPNLRKQLLKRIYWALEQLKQLKQLQ